MGVNSVKDDVEELLNTHNECRDSDNVLVSFFWYKHLVRIGIHPNQMTCIDLLKLMKNGALPSFGAISRSRRKLQEEKPELRGSAYEYRKGKLQRDTKLELGYTP